MRWLPDSGPERRRAVLLLCVLVALAAWVWWPAAPGMGGAAESGPGPAVVASSVGGELGSLTLPERVQLEALERAPGPLQVDRNPFRFGARPLPPPPPPTETPVVAAPPAPPQPTGPPPIPLRLSGRVEAPDGRVVITLKDPGTGALFHATEGEIVDGRYRVIKVGAQSVVVSYLDGSGQRTIALGG